MGPSTWILTNADDSTYVDRLEITPQQVGGKADGYRIDKHRLQGGPRDGVDVVHVDNGTIRFVVVPTRGMGLWKAWCDGEQIGWNSPVPGPVHPALVPLSDPSGLGWLDGFDELLARCGLESNGAPEFDGQGKLLYGLHGRIANKPAHSVQVSVDGETGEIAVEGIVDEIRFHFFKLRLHTTIRTRVGENTIEVHDRVENLSASPTDMQMLYHINVGPPLLGPGARVVAPVQTLVPRDARAVEGIDDWADYHAPLPGYQEQVYLLALQSDPRHRTGVLLKNPSGDRGVSVHFDTRQLPCFTLWKNQIAQPDGYVTGIEPATNFPNPHGFEQRQGRVVSLAPGASCSFDLALRIHRAAEQVEAAEAQITALRRSDPVMLDQPQPGWCA